MKKTSDYKKLKRIIVKKEEAASTVNFVPVMDEGKGSRKNIVGK